jgi:hypothetical protein
MPLPLLLLIPIRKFLSSKSNIIPALISLILIIIIVATIIILSIAENAILNGVIKAFLFVTTIFVGRLVFIYTRKFYCNNINNDTGCKISKAASLILSKVNKK